MGMDVAACDDDEGHLGHGNLVTITAVLDGFRRFQEQYAWELGVFCVW